MIVDAGKSLKTVLQTPGYTLSNSNIKVILSYKNLHYILGKKSHRELDYVNLFIKSLCLELSAIWSFFIKQSYFI